MPDHFAAKANHHSDRHGCDPRKECIVEPTHGRRDQVRNRSDNQSAVRLKASPSGLLQVVPMVGGQVVETGAGGSSRNCTLPSFSRAQSRICQPGFPGALVTETINFRVISTSWHASSGVSACAQRTLCLSREHCSLLGTLRRRQTRPDSSCCSTAVEDGPFCNPAVLGQSASTSTGSSSAIGTMRRVA